MVLTEWDIVGRVVGASFMGGLLGWDNEDRKMGFAGVRTHMLVSAGSSLFVGTALLALFPVHFEGGGQEPVVNDEIEAYLLNPDKVLARRFKKAGKLRGEKLRIIKRK